MEYRTQEQRREEELLETQLEMGGMRQRSGRGKVCFRTIKRFGGGEVEGAYSGSVVWCCTSIAPLRIIYSI